MRFAFLVLSLCSLFAFSACGGTESDSYCCINGAYYSCDSADDASSCVAGDNRCTRDSSMDDTCN